MKLLSRLRQEYMIAKASFKPDSYCNCCGKEIGALGPYTLIKYGKPPVFLCHLCRWDYYEYSRHKDRYDFFSKVT